MTEQTSIEAQAFIDEYKGRFRIFNTSEDELIKQQLKDSYEDIQSIIGRFNPNEYLKGKELIFERTRYVRNEALEYFYRNFRMMIMDASIDLAGEKVAD